MWVFRIAALFVVVCAASLVMGGSRATADVVVIIDKSSQQMSVVVDGRARYVWQVSTGRSGYGTPSGRFRPQWMARTYFSKKYYDSPMPYSIFFYHGFAIHGTDSIYRLGGPASHGCVRLHPRNAATLFALVQRHGMSNTRIIIGNAIALERPERWGAGDQDELRLITQMADRLMLAEQIERQEALAKMAQMRASDALRRMQARSDGTPFVRNPDDLAIAIGVEINNVPFAPEDVVMELPEPDTTADATRPAKGATREVPVPRKRVSAEKPPARRVIGDPRGRPSASKPGKPAKPPARAERRPDKVTLKLGR